MDFDEWLREGRTALLRDLVERLAHEPGSLYRADLLGGNEWFGWGLQTSLTADLIDALNFQTSATAQNKKARLRHPVKRPPGKQQIETVHEVSISDGGSFTAALGGMFT